MPYDSDSHYDQSSSTVYQYPVFRACEKSNAGTINNILYSVNGVRNNNTAYSASDVCMLEANDFYCTLCH